MQVELSQDELNFILWAMQFARHEREDKALYIRLREQWRQEVRSARRASAGQHSR